jgi:hypothetical protein
MNTAPETEKRADRSKNFWEMKARKYPLPFDPESLRKTETVIALVKSKGVEISGAGILDIGCYPVSMARRLAGAAGAHARARRAPRSRCGLRPLAGDGGEDPDLRARPPPARRRTSLRPLAQELWTPWAPSARAVRLPPLRASQKPHMAIPRA